MAEGDNSLPDYDFVRLEDTATPAIGIAISGGGVRAAFYGVGALLYLVHSGLNKQVKLISSVSGGSIPNAVIAMNCDFQNEDRDRFDDLMSMMCNRLARKGVFFVTLLMVVLISGILWGVICTAAVWFIFSLVNLHTTAYMAIFLITLLIGAPFQAVS
jgi:Patatin-like phospholipase